MFYFIMKGFAFGYSCLRVVCKLNGCLYVLNVRFED